MPNMFGGDQFHPAYDSEGRLGLNQVLVGNDLYTIEEDGRVSVEKVCGHKSYTTIYPGEVAKLRAALRAKGDWKPKAQEKPMSEQSDYNVGDVVFLKSGGPSMTVSQGRGSTGLVYGHIACQWFDDDDHLHEEAFRPETLTRSQKSVSEPGPFDDPADTSDDGEPTLESYLRVQAERGVDHHLLTASAELDMDVKVYISPLTNEVCRAFAFEVHGNVLKPRGLSEVPAGARRSGLILTEEEWGTVLALMTRNTLTKQEQDVYLKIVGKP